MKFTITASTAFILLTGVAIALPQPVAKTRTQRSQSGSNLFARQAVTTDGSCGIKESGAGKGFHCPTAQYRCCSQWGWCGDSAEHCGTGCQSEYGSCTGVTSPPPPTTTTTTPPPTDGRPQLGSVPYGVILSACTVPGTVALTFDDGPYIYTQDLLNILNDKGVKATFFVNGANWGAPITNDANAQQVLQNAYNGGHQIASHTWSHANLDTLSEDGIRAQMNQLESALLGIIGRYPTYMRPPYLSCGDTCISTLSALGYHIITTNLDTLDWQFNTASTISQSQDIFTNALATTSAASGGWLVLAHEVQQTTVDMLAGYMIDTAKARGYRLVTLGECMGDPEANWYRTAL